jgi:hypothetical protein
MIIGLTHTRDLVPIEKLTVITKVSIGEPPTEGRNYPKKLDHFRFQTKDPTGDWMIDEELDQLLKKKQEDEGTEEGVPVRSFNIQFVSDDIEQIFATSYAWWGSSERKCFGDGVQAERVLSEIKDKKLLEEYKGKRSAPWTPCGDDGCPELEQKLCKPHGQLRFMIPEQRVVGAVAVFNTTSYESIRRIFSGLTGIANITRGRLAGLKLRLVLKPGQTRYRDDKGTAKTSNAFFAHVEFRASDHEKMLQEMLEQSYELDFLAAAQERKIRVLGTSLPTREHPGVVTLTEEEDAKVIQPEFYPETKAPEEAPEPAKTEDKDIIEYDKLSKRMKLTKAKHDALLHHYGGELEAATKFLSNVLKATKKLKPTVKQVNEWMEQGITNPEWLMKELADQIKNLKPAKKSKPLPEEAPKEQAEVPKSEEETPQQQEEEPPPHDDGDQWTNF